jgi:hypothetical protein
MYLKALLIFVALFGLFGCKRKVNEEMQLEMALDKNLEITIEYAQSSKLDLTRALYTVYNLERPQFDAHFKLLPTEKDQIIEKYYSVSLYELADVDSIRGTVYIGDNCMDMPKLYTILTFKSNEKIQKIQIDNSCDKYLGQNKIYARKVNDFLDFVENIVLKKPEVKSARTSDIIYY